MCVAVARSQTGTVADIDAADKTGIPLGLAETSRILVSYTWE